jgi:hypothetical protein
MDERALREGLRRIVVNFADELRHTMTQREWWLAASRVALGIVALGDRHFDIDRSKPPA